MFFFMFINLRVCFFFVIFGVCVFFEFNFCIYVMYKGKFGIYFFSLDVDYWLVVLGVCMFFYLFYFYVDMKVEKNGDCIDYVSKWKNDKEVVFYVVYWFILVFFIVEKDLFDYWLIEWYRFYIIN